MNEKVKMIPEYYFQPKEDPECVPVADPRFLRCMFILEIIVTCAGFAICVWYFNSQTTVGIYFFNLLK